MSSSDINWFTTGCWGLFCASDIKNCCGSKKEPQTPMGALAPRVSYPYLSLVSSTAGLISSLNVGTLFFSGIRHVAGGLLHIMGLVVNIEKIDFLEKAALAEESLSLNGESLARRQMVVPYLGAIFSISMIVFSILGIAAAFAFPVSKALIVGVGVVAAVSFGLEFSLKKTLLAKENFGSQLLLI